MLELKHLRVLKEVADRGSFSAAADALSYTQPAVSHQIAALERETGTKLIERGARGIRLTETGSALLRHAEAIMARVAEAEAELQAIGNLEGGRLRLVSFPSGGASLIPPATAEFRRRHPHVELVLSVADPAGALSGLKAGEVDIAVLVESGFGPEQRDERVERLHLLDDPMFAALPPDHPLARKRTLRLADLAGESWMHDSSSCPDAAVFLRACHAAGFEPSVAFTNDDYGAIQGFVAAGVGVALIPQLALQGVRDDIVVRPLGAPVPSRRVVAATLADAYRSPATEAMLAILKDVSADYLAGRRPPLAAVG